MFCLSCGTQLPEDANYCLKCGKPQKSNVQSVTHSNQIQWETCEIQWVSESDFFNTKGYFEAKAIGPNGVYGAAKTGAFKVKKSIVGVPLPYDANGKETYERLVAHLVQEGWEPIGIKGPDWFSDKFRRHTK